MTTSISEYTYHLSPERIAQSPLTPRESAKLMIVHRNSLSREHQHIADLPHFFRAGDIVVVNNTKVFHARLHGTLDTGTPVELFLIRPQTDYWIALGKQGKKIKPTMKICIASDFEATVVKKNPDGSLLVDCKLPAAEVIKKANQYGEIPVPPYIKQIPQDSDYQTVYAKRVGSVAAPTAGFHLTTNILTQLKHMGVTVVEITLHVGLGTFMPIKSDALESHTMHSEWAEITKTVATVIQTAKQNKQRIIAIGTTTVRTLEGVASLHKGTVTAFSGDINLFIKPGFDFKVIDAMLTNFHLPKSTLIVLVSSFAGRGTILSAYKEAIVYDYRFFSFGDAMLIL